MMFNAFHMWTADTNSGGKVSKVMGGQQAVYRDDGRLKMARDLERVWPGVVKTTRRFGRPQHKVNWNKFDNKLIRRKDIDWDSLQGQNEFGMKLEAVKPVKSEHLRRLLDGGIKE